MTTHYHTCICVYVTILGLYNNVSLQIKHTQNTNFTKLMMIYVQNRMEYSRIKSTCITNWKNWFSYLTVYSLNRPKLRYNEQSK